MSKSDNLRELEGKLKLFKIPKFFTFYVDEWYQNQDKLIIEIKKVFERESSIAVRSSAIDEDKSDYSNAGKYLSILNIYD